MRRPGRAGIFAIAGIVILASAIGGPVAYRKFREAKESRFTSGCANHANHHALGLAGVLHDNRVIKFSSETNTRTVLEQNKININLPQWLYEYGSACPESFYRDKSIGYLFFADALEITDDPEKDTLVLICPAENHHGSSEHCHAVLSNGRTKCLKSNVAALEVLREHLGKATNEIIPYSTNARTLMRREIAARERYEQKRKR
jgi:hypothetical protein